MQVQLFTVRLTKDFLITDQNKLNSFLEKVTFKKSSTQFVKGKPNYWSVLIHYENKTEVEQKQEKLITELTTEEQEHFDYFRKWRVTKSKEEMIAPFMVLSNKSIMEMIKTKPEFEKELLNIHGIGEAKVAKYGCELITLLDNIR